jgi:hypothetical protein
MDCEKSIFLGLNSARMLKWKTLAFSLGVMLFVPSLLADGFRGDTLCAFSNSNNNYPLSSHWVNGWGYRDELNSSDTDYKNF